jgi:hypothetical protein
MFARALVIKVKPGCSAELTRTFEQEVMPRFQKEEDFRGLLAFIVPDGTEALCLSLWDQKDQQGGFWTGVLGALMALIRVGLGKPLVHFCEVGNSSTEALGQETDQGEGIESTVDLRVYQSALQSFKVAPVQATLNRGFPLVWCLMNSFRMPDPTLDTQVPIKSEGSTLRRLP